MVSNCVVSDWRACERTWILSLAAIPLFREVFECLVFLLCTNKITHLMCLVLGVLCPQSPCRRTCVGDARFLRHENMMTDIMGSELYPVRV